MHRHTLSRLAVGLAALVFCSLSWGRGLFPSTNYDTLNFPVAVVVADVNGDGHPDMIVLGQDTTITILLGRGDGSFVKGTHYYVTGTSTNPTALAVADLTGNGKLDIIVTDSANDTIIVLLGNGDGTFQSQTDTEFVNNTGTPAPTYQTGGGPVSIAVADLTGNGKQDVVVTNYDDGTVGVFMGKGDGTFGSEIAYSCGNGPTNVEIADMNGDGKPDLVVSNAVDDTLAVMFGNGDGSFKAPILTRLGAINNTATLQTAVVADINKDGKLDVISTTTNDSGSTIEYLQGRGNGTFAPIQFLVTGLQTRYVKVADLDGDGNLDLVTGSFANNTITVRLGNGDGTFGPATLYPATDLSAATGKFAFDVGDLRGNKRFDIMAVDPSDGTVDVMLNGGHGDFHPANTTLVGNTPADAASGDLNGDHNLDLVEVNAEDGTVGVLLGNGDGTFQPLVAYPVGAHPQKVLLTDVDGDGVLDIVTLDNGDQTISVLIGNGDGTFKPARSYPAGPNPVDFAAADMDQDGSMDIVVANSVVNTVSVLHNRGNGTFAAPVAYAAGIHINGLAVGVLRPGGFPDVVEVGDFVGVLWNDGKGGLEPIVINKEGLSTHLYFAKGSQIRLADTEHDGHLDILVADTSDSQLVVLLGNGHGFFEPTPNDFPACATPNNLATADMNDDGHLDVVVSCAGSNSVSVMLGNGKGGFVGNSYTVEINPRAVVTGDFNNDKDMDLAVVNGGSNTVNLLLQIPGLVASDHAPVAQNLHLLLPDGAQPLNSAFAAADSDNDPLFFGVVGPSQNSSISFTSDTGVFQYTANQGFTGADSFQYQASDGIKLSNIANINVLVQTNTAGQSSSSHKFLGIGAFGPLLLPLLCLGVFLRRRRR